jgi:hypothetical protein
MDSASLRATEDGYLANADGSVPAVIHQWDRHWSFVSKLPKFAFLAEDEEATDD